MGNAKSHRKFKSETVYEKAWYVWDLYQVTFRGCPYCKKKMSQSAAEGCVYTHMLAYYRYKTMRMIQDDPEYWFAKWGSVLPDDPLTDSGIRFDKFNHWYWERKGMEELAEKVDTNGYDLKIAQNVWADFQKEWKAERIGDFSAYRRAFQQCFREIRVKKPGDLVYAKYRGERTHETWYKATVKAINAGKIRIVYDDLGKEHTWSDDWIMLDREGRSWLKAYSEENPNDPALHVSIQRNDKSWVKAQIITKDLKTVTVRYDAADGTYEKQLPIGSPHIAIGQGGRWNRNDRVSAQDHLGKWYEAVICEILGDQVLVHYEGWPDQYNEWIDCDSKRIEAYPFDLFAGLEIKCETEPPKPQYESTLRRHVVTDLAEFAERNHVHCEDCKEPMTAQTFHLTRCFHMICKLCTHNRGDRCFCGRLFATPMAMPAVFETALSQIGTLAKWECVVCTEPMTTKNFHLTSCFHKVCTICVAELAKRRDPRCPVCREKINA